MNQYKVSSKVLFLDKKFDIFTINHWFKLIKITLIMTFKDRWRNYKSIGIFCIVFIIFLIIFIIRNIFQNNKKQENKEEWIDISEFPSTLEINKE